MNYIRHLTAFFDRVAVDERFNPTHISLYIALFQFWNVNRFQNPISISRSEMMGVSKIHAKATYHKVIKDLHEFGLIKYRPSYNPYRGSEVDLVQLDETLEQQLNGNRTRRRSNNGQGLNSYRTKIETSTEPMNEPYINNTNIINSKLAYEQSNEDTSSNFDGIGQEEKANNPTTTNHQRTTKKKGEDETMHVPASCDEVKKFFEEENNTKLEAEKFFNYFQSNGWKVGGRSPMKDWRAAARNWMLNSKKFNNGNHHPAGNLHVSTNKNYAEPL